MAAHDEDDDDNNSNAANEMAWSRLNNIETKKNYERTDEEIIIKNPEPEILFCFSVHTISNIF